jgi:hypothetical protein
MEISLVTANAETLRRGELKLINDSEHSVFQEDYIEIE